MLKPGTILRNAYVGSMADGRDALKVGDKLWYCGTQEGKNYLIYRTTPHGEKKSYTGVTVADRGLVPMYDTYADHLIITDLVHTAPYVKEKYDGLLPAEVILLTLPQHLLPPLLAHEYPWIQNKVLERLAEST